MKKQSIIPYQKGLGRPRTKVISGNAEHRGRKLAQRRLEMKLTQPKLAARLSEGISSDILTIRVDTISGWENGYKGKELSDEIIDLIHEIMEVSKEYFDEPLPDEKSPTPHLSNWGKDLQSDVPKIEENFSELAKTLRYLGNLEKLSPETLWQHTREYIKQIKNAFRYSNNYQIFVYSLAQKRFIEKDFVRLVLNQREEPDPPDPIIINVLGNHHRDPQCNYWIKELNHLNSQLSECIDVIKKSNATSTLNIFALAPQPLVVELGRRLSNIKNVKIIPPYRANNFEVSWGWREVFKKTDYRTNHLPCEKEKAELKVVLNLSLSTYIEKQVIVRATGSDLSIWELTLNKPDDEYLKSSNQLDEFREHYQGILDEIVERHGKDISLHVFLSVPIAIAFEIGRLWNPDTDPALILYGMSTESEDYYPIHTLKKD